MAVLVRAAVLTSFNEIARELQLDTQALLRSVGLTQTLLADPEQRVPAEAAVTLLERAAAAGACPTFGLRMAQSRQLSDLGVVSLLISHQPTLRAALAALIRYRHLLNDTLAMLLENAGRMVILREELVSAVPARQATELAIGVLYRLCGALMGPRWKPVSVNFSHAAPEDLRLHRQVFRCRIEFGCDFNGIVCAASDLDAPNPTADPALARYAQRFVDTLPPVSEPSIVLDVRRAIYLMLPSGRAGSAAVAQGLGLSLRTLQRQLDAAGSSFAGLLDDVRRELVLRYMEHPRYSLARISEMLGYATPGSFTRWFTAQFGMAPQLWRRKRGRSSGG